LTCVLAVSVSLSLCCSLWSLLLCWPLRLVLLLWLML
jgi:hypothetical protein